MTAGIWIARGDDTHRRYYCERWNEKEWWIAYRCVPSRNVAGASWLAVDQRLLNLGVLPTTYRTLDDARAVLERIAAESTGPPAFLVHAVNGRHVDAQVAS